MNTENLTTLKIHKLTQAQYDRELANGSIDENALYLTPEEIPVPIAKGGTGASTATGALNNLGAASSSHVHSEATTSKAGLMSSSDKTKLNAIADYIVAQDNVSSGGGIGNAKSNWGYRKWNSGRAECYLKMPIESVACNTAVGSWYRTDTISAPEFPFEFVYYPTVNMYFETVSGTGGMVWSTGTSTATPTTKPINVYIIRMSSSAAITGYLNIYAIGRWK